MPQDRIVVRGAREHNLKNIDIVIPRDKLVVITGLSGSGKSSLAFDTIFAEGQRRYVESLSSYARQFLGQMDKPDVDHIDGLSPAISIDQKSTSHNPRSTVGTVTEIWDYMRLLYARVGHPHCPNCGREISRQSVEQIVDAIVALPDNSRLMLLAPLVRERKGEYKNIFEDMRRAGYVRVRVDGDIRDLGEEIELDKYKKHTIEVVIDRLVIRHPHAAAEETPGSNGHATGLRLVAERPAAYVADNADAPGDPELSQRTRVADSVETTLKLGNGIVLVSIIGGEEKLYSEHFACVYCGISLEEIEPRSFSFNSPKGACPECTGLGTKLEIDEDLIVTNPDLSINEGAILPWSRFASASQWYTTLLKSVAKRFVFSLDTPWKDLTDEARNVVLHGANDEVSFYYRNRQGTRREHNTAFEGVVPNLMRRYKEATEHGRQEIEQYMSAVPCPVCKGARLKKEVLAVTVGNRNIVEVGNLSIVNALRFFDALTAATSASSLPADGGALPAAPTVGDVPFPAKSATANGHSPSFSVVKSTPKSGKNGSLIPSEEGDASTGRPRRPEDRLITPLTEREGVIARQILKEIRARLGFLVDVGLDYLSLFRSAASLSGGEAQRIRLATQIGSSLMGVLYILDEPSIGLHQRDNARLIRTLIHLRDLGNTLLVVEHDEDTMRAADHIIDIGPGAGEHGGYVVAEGTLDEIAANPASLTGQFISGKRRIATPRQRRAGNGRKLLIRGARENNLKNIDVEIPLGMFVSVTGVSGSGKSSLVNEILHKSLAMQLNRAHARPGDHDGIDGVDALDKVIDIDQSPIGRTPRSNPATYTGAFTPIRELFAQVPEARLRGYQPGRFSFNIKGGRCEVCKGEGILTIEMNFLPDVYVPCEACKGKRYNREALEIHYKGKTISEVLDMTVEEALRFFEAVPSIANKLSTLNDVGLGYIRLGQPATTLSGGEAQRIKLATELSRRATGRTLYILDEPTTGLHFADVERLLHVLQRLVDTGNTVVVIEHNLDVIKSADWIVDLGPEGGDRGGEILAEGTPEDIARLPQSYTGHFLARILPVPIA
ncbi:MAG TPA: excinuclease ABC subunit UvrA [Ktedonobacterales bacterium]|nr:excinuclease ABC subunit UvrA [Ktedonobacterales bacterium]